MLINFKNKIIRNLKVLGLIFIIIFTITIATLSNHQKNLSKNEYGDFINNIYLKKTLNEIVKNLEPRYKKYNHKIKSGETFDKILNSYFINKEEIKAIKESLSKKVNINKLNTNQKIQIVLDKTNNKIKEFIFQISNTQKIYLSKNSEDLEFNESKPKLREFNAIFSIHTSERLLENSSNILTSMIMVSIILLYNIVVKKFTYLGI